MWLLYLCRNEFICVLFQLFGIGEIVQNVFRFLFSGFGELQYVIVMLCWNFGIRMMFIGELGNVIRLCLCMNLVDCVSVVLVLFIILLCVGLLVQVSFSVVLIVVCCCVLVGLVGSVGVLVVFLSMVCVMLYMFWCMCLSLVCVCLLIFVCDSDEFSVNFSFWLYRFVLMWKLFLVLGIRVLFSQVCCLFIVFFRFLMVVCRCFWFLVGSLFICGMMNELMMLRMLWFCLVIVLVWIFGMCVGFRFLCVWVKIVGSFFICVVVDFSCFGNGVNLCVIRLQMVLLVRLLQICGFYLDDCSILVFQIFDCS